MEITQDNIEALLLDYAEGNLDAQTLKTLEQYLALHPEYKELADEYDPSLTLTDEKNVQFGSKEMLYADIMQIKDRQRKIIRQNNTLKRMFVVVTDIAAVVLLAFVFIKPQFETQTPQSVSSDNTLQNTEHRFEPADLSFANEEKNIADANGSLTGENKPMNDVNGAMNVRNGSNAVAEQNFVQTGGTGTGKEKRYDVVIRRNNTMSEPLQQLIWLAENQWRNSDRKVLRKDGNEIRIIYVNDDNTVRGSVDAKMLGYPDNTMIRYVNNAPQSSDARYGNTNADRYRETIIQDVTLEELDSVMKILQTR